MTFDIAINFILDSEGGYVFDKNDPGGETNLGISKRSYPDLDIVNLTLQQAKDIYLQDYWTPCRCDELPDGLDVAVFDAAVNQGPRIAIKLLQKSAGVTPDGVIGPKTLAACRGNTGLLTRFLAHRGEYYGSLSTFQHFGLGWMRRLFNLQEYIWQNRET